MNLTQESIQDQRILTVHEERIDAHNSPDLKAVLAELINQYGSVIVQLAQVRFIDSSGLGALLSGYKQAATKSGRLALVQVQPPVLAMLEITRLNRVFELYADVNEALAQPS